MPSSTPKYLLSRVLRTQSMLQLLLEFQIFSPTAKASPVHYYTQFSMTHFTKVISLKKISFIKRVTIFQKDLAARLN